MTNNLIRKACAAANGTLEQMGVTEDSSTITQVEINHYAVRTLWEGLNKEKKFRKVLYLPYVDGYTVLLVTDTDGNTLDYIDDKRLCWVYFPEEYNSDLPVEYRRICPEQKRKKKLAYTEYSGAELVQFIPFARFEGKTNKYVIAISTNKPLASVDIFVVDTKKMPIDYIDHLTGGLVSGKIIKSITIKEMMQGYYNYL